MPGSISPNTSPLAGLDASQYNSNSFTYPLNLNADGAGLGHYMLFFINQNNGTQYSTSTVNNVAPTAQPQINQNNANNLNTVGNFSNYIGKGTNSQQTQNLSRVSTVIGLYMPKQVDATYSANWDVGTIGVASGLFAGDTRSWIDIGKDIGTSLLSNVGQMLTDFDFTIADDAEFAGKIAVNDHAEVMFKSVGFREFSYEFLFVPQSEAEAINVQNIIQAFKFYWAPELVAGTRGRIWLYPAEFDIKFISGGTENSWINKISTCALTDINVDYTPSGAWTAHRATSNGVVPGVTTRLRLKFKELEQMRKDLILQGF